MNNTNASIMQLSLNEGARLRNIYTNVAVDFQTYNFENYKLILSGNMDKIIPEYLILNLYDNTTTLETIYNYGRNIYINFQIGNQTLLNIPLSILWNLKQPEICENKLYLHIPFETFFGNIYIADLIFREVTFTLVNYINLSNYISDYSLLCKTYRGDNQYRRNNIDTSSCCIQQISSLEVQVSLDNRENVSNEFKIQTTSFQGFSKGFFIETNNINELSTMRFYINGLTRIDYNKLMIRNYCQKINDNMIFFPFNPDTSVNERSFNSFVGSINLSEARQSSLNLIFDTPRCSVKVYSMNMNDYIQRRSEIITSQTITNIHLVEDFTRHSLTPIERMETNIMINNISINTVYVNNYNTIIYNNSYSDMSNLSEQYPLITHSSIEDLIIDIGFHRLIPEDRRTCGISLDEIETNKSYMTCSQCSSNFNEEPIRQWLIDKRTCPACRGMWSDFNIYINI